MGTCTRFPVPPCTPSVLWPFYFGAGFLAVPGPGIGENYGMFGGSWPLHGATGNRDEVATPLTWVAPGSLGPAASARLGCHIGQSTACQIFVHLSFSAFCRAQSAGFRG